MSTQQAVSIPSGKARVYTMIAAALVLVAAYLFLGGQDVRAQSTAPAPAATQAPESKPTIEGWNQMPLSEESKKWLTENNIQSIILLDNKLQARVADKYGKEVKVCARTVEGGTRVEGECAKMKASTMTRTTNISVDITESSPGWCRTIIFGQVYYYPC